MQVVLLLHCCSLCCSAVDLVFTCMNCLERNKPVRLFHPHCRWQTGKEEHSTFAHKQTCVNLKQWKLLTPGEKKKWINRWNRRTSAPAMPNALGWGLGRRQQQGHHRAQHARLWRLLQLHLPYRSGQAQPAGPGSLASLL